MTTWTWKINIDNSRNPLYGKCIYIHLYSAHRYSIIMVFCGHCVTPHALRLSEENSIYAVRFRFCFLVVIATMFW